jgi:hypothetical protein
MIKSEEAETLREKAGAQFEEENADSVESSRYLYTFPGEVARGK